MTDSLSVKKSTVRLMRGDITDMEVEAFVFYARHDLQLGSGFGTAISVRGGPSVQNELKELGVAKTTDAIVTGAGKMKASHIIHAVGPRFQEEDLRSKLEVTVRNCLSQADQKGIKQIAFPAMGTGFYGVPLQTSAEVTLKTICDYLSGDTKITEVIVCLIDSREYQPFHHQFKALEAAFAGV